MLNVKSQVESAMVSKLQMAQGVLPVSIFLLTIRVTISYIRSIDNLSGLSGVSAATWATLIFCLCVSASVAALIVSKLCPRKSVVPFPGITIVPGAHRLLGHYTYLFNPAKHAFVFKDHATPSGISAFYAPLSKKCITVLRADHVRAILRQSSSREFVQWIARHGRKTLGEESIILIAGGLRWKKQRNVIQKAFTVDVVKGGRKIVAECARGVVDWLLRACSEDSYSQRRGGSVHKMHCQGVSVDANGKRKVRLEAEDFFKLFSLQVFGKVSMGYDFQCFTSTLLARKDLDNHSNCCYETTSLENRFCTSSPNKACTCLQMPSIALSFDFLSLDIGKRAEPQQLLNPFMQFYSIPTSYNKEYHRHKAAVCRLMDDIIKEEFEILCDKECSAKAEDTKKNMVALLLLSMLEEKVNPSEDSSASKCPFASPHTSKSTSSNSSFIPPLLTTDDKQEIIDDVSKILLTLLMAGYETTAISLSCAMYCLAKNPRCQEHCAEEARRILGPREENNDVTNDDELLYCRAVFTEAIRLHVPVAFTSRVLEKDIVFDTGFKEKERETVKIPRGTRAIISPTMIHTSEFNFERANEFIPERWVRWENGRWVDRDCEKETLSSLSMPPCTISKENSMSTDPVSNTAFNTVNNVSAANPQNLFAFSDGARNCVGRRLAVMESTIMLAVLLRDLRVEFAEEGFEIEMIRKFVTMAPSRMPVMFSQRE